MKKLAALGALLALAAGAWLALRDRRPTGFILISIDTLRADHLGAYGYPLDTSPFFDEFSERGTLFTNAIVQLPGTLPSHMSIFTGLYPAEHGVYPPDSVLSPEIRTLPEAFQAAGYRTAGFTEGGYVAGHYGFERGFDTFRAVNTGKPGAAGRTFDLVRDWIDTLEEGDKFFVFVHTYEVHDPYIAMEPFGRNSWPGEPPDTWEPTGANLTAASLGELPVTPEAVRYFGALYDAGIRYVDEVLRGFMEHLWAADLARDTTVIITSDHGEEFLEHGSFVHRQVYNETLHVPLLIRRLGQRRGARVSRLVQSVDLAPTLLDLAGIRRSGMTPSGTSLVPLLRGARQATGAEAYAEGMSVPTRTLYRQTDSGLYQLLLTREGDESVRRELYRLDDDPRQQKDLAPRRSALVRELEAALERYRWDVKANAGRAELSEEQTDRLKALGYLQ
ncbi:MAG: sulfatase [Acidobacteriota bacterium]|nr:sulfatase [Acidobacteriota bacterium]MDH3522120.1 sulfatase [Acidobacteriota bacterium]